MLSGAATLISGGRCNVMDNVFLNTFGTATLISGGHCDGQVKLAMTSVGAATLISGGHCNGARGHSIRRRGRPPGFWVVIATAPPHPQ